ncbi:calcium/proton exchanger [Actinomadura sp. DC4]|uniref:calcium/proton exchanger n=1 Tax=Actinomadura sp. DC4 TaxID=3055069 RepID=UPI0025B0AE3C|nr:calcium/proton exchanger [Actinomadura sp. DC4]MDN3359984.1 calcium/proton exchanger [Actinomadura sp. DC4]
MGFTRSDWRLIIITVVVAGAAGTAYYAKLGGNVAPFVIAAIALALLATLVGRSVEELGDRLGSGATGVVQSALGNLPELFVVLFALRDKLYGVATATIVGSILANVLLVLGLAFLFGGIKHGRQTFGSEGARTMSMLMVLSVAAMLVPSLTSALGSHATKAALHERDLSIVVSVLLLGLFVASLPASLRRQKSAEGGGEGEGSEPASRHSWSMGVALGMLAITGVGAAFVSDWFVAALQPAMSTLGISEAFAGLVIVAIAGNAVENVVGIQLALKNQSDFALSLILQSPLQISLVVAPALVLLSPLVGASFTLVLSPLLIAVLIMAVVITVLVVLDGESNWLEGATLIILYGIIATAFWWG